MAEYRVFGPVQLISDQLAMDLGPPKQRLVLAALMIDAGRPLTIGTLVDRVWGEDPPTEARNALYAHIMRIRRVLSAVTRAEDTPAELVRGPAGYTLDISREQIDLHRFRHLVRQARQPEHNVAERAALLRCALDLWRGAPLADLGGPWVDRVRDGCRQEHVDATMTWARAELRAGNHEAVLARASDLMDSYPLVEPLVAALMRALGAAGRVAEALDCYRTTRQRLAEELGVDPTAELQEAHRTILRGVPALTGSPGAVAVPVARGGPGSPICQLPPDVADFTGRSVQCRRLVEMLTGQLATETPVVVLTGPPGVGKSALALHAAHEVRQRFPDGQLFVSLAGASAQAREPADVLDGMLRAVGVPPWQIPDALDQRTALLRARLAGRRMLIVADDAAGPAQIRPLLPGTAGCAMLVTSRNRLAGLEAATLVTVECLSHDEAVRLLGRIAGDQRIAEARQAVEALVAACGRLPLALRIVGARLAARPGWPVGRLVDLVSDQRRRLDELAVDDLAVRSSIALSYHALDRRTRRLLRRLALLGPHDCAEWVAVALLGGHGAGELVPWLADRSLIAPVGTDLTGEPRYRLHDLVRDYAAERLADESAADRQSAGSRLLTGYHQLAYRADRRLLGERFAPQPESPVGPEVVPAALADRLTQEPGAWFDAERRQLIAATTRACADGELTLAVQLASCQFAYQDMRACYDDIDRLWQMILQTAERTGDRPAAATAHFHLGLVAGFRGYLNQGLALLDQAVTGYRRSVNAGRLPYCLAGRAYCSMSLGRYPQAVQDAAEGLALARHGADLPAQIWNLQMLGTSLAHLGRHGDGRRHCREALELTRRTGHPVGEHRALRHLAQVSLLAGDIPMAIVQARASIDVATRAAHPWGVADSTGLLTDAYQALGRYRDAIDTLSTLLPVFDRFHGRYGRGRCLLRLGQAHQALGNAPQSARYLSESLTIFSELGLESWLDRARQLLAHVALLAPPELADT
jgi:DNA-binding SARP family transcriptional activator/tetratricopeptide (TPR) repeat protein